MPLFISLACYRTDCEVHCEGRTTGNDVNRSPRPDTSEHPTHLNLHDTPLSQQSSSVHRMNCRLQDAGRMTTSTSYRRNRYAGVDELHVGEPMAYLPPDLVVS
jgi:hypothetical protein